MEGSKLTVPGRGTVPVVAFKVAVVQVVIIFHLHLGLVDHDLVIPTVAPCRADASMHQMVTCMNGVRGNDPVDDHA